MNNEKKEIFVYADWAESERVQLTGILTVDRLKGKEIFSFAYNDNWLESGNTKMLNPDLGFFQVNNI